MKKDQKNQINEPIFDGKHVPDIIRSYRFNAQGHWVDDPVDPVNDGNEIEKDENQGGKTIED